MRLVSDCIITETAARICREEEGKEVCFKHSDYEIVCDVVPIEKCVFTKAVGGKRCDYLFLFDKRKQNYNYLQNRPSPAFYVELKGDDLVGACEQLLNSIDLTKEQIEGFDINALVVSSRKFVPKYDNNEFYRNIKRIIRKNVQFEVTPYTVDF